jgi:hypothetical protein
MEFRRCRDISGIGTFGIPKASESDLLTINYNMRIVPASCLVIMNAFQAHATIPANLGIALIFRTRGLA